MEIHAPEPVADAGTHEDPERAKAEEAMRTQAAADAAQREIARIAALKQQEVEAAAAAKRDAAFNWNVTLLAALNARDTMTIVETLRVRPEAAQLEPEAVELLAQQLPDLTAALTATSSLIGAQLELSRVLGAMPKDSVLATATAALRARALAAAQHELHHAGGPGGRFIHAALVAQISLAPGDLATARTAFAELVKAARVNLVLDQLPVACAALVRSEPGHALHATTTLACTIEPEHTWMVKQAFEVNGSMTTTDVEHRGWRLSVRGEIRAGGVLPVEVADAVDETTDTLERPFAPVLAGLIDGIWNELVTPLETETANAALAAGRAAIAGKNVKRAENELAIHAVIAGPSEELDQLLAPYRVTFDQLRP